MKTFIEKIKNGYFNHPAWYIILSIPVFAIMKSGGFQGDVNCWIRWSSWIYEHGLSNVYQSGTDYVPLLHYILWFFNLFAENLDQIGSKISRLRDLMFMCDVLIALMLYYVGRKFGGFSKEQAVNGSWIYLLTGGILFNSLFWGQLEAMLALLLVTSVLLAINSRPGWSLIFLVLALNFKIIAVVFVPIIALLNINVILKSTYSSIVFQILLPPVLLQLLILLPFYHEGDLSSVWKVVSTSAGRYPQLSLNAPNLWTILYDADSLSLSSQQLVFGLSKKLWGIMIFCFLSCFSLFPLALNAFNVHNQRKVSHDRYAQMVFISIALTYSLFVFFNTEMHERYWHLSVVFFAFYCQIRKKYFQLSILGITYLLTLERVLKHSYHLAYEDVLMFNQRFLGILFLLQIIWMFYYLIEEYKFSRAV